MPVAISVPVPRVALPARALVGAVALLARFAKARASHRDRPRRALARACVVTDSPSGGAVKFTAATALTGAARSRALGALVATGAAAGNEVVAEASARVATVGTGRGHEGVVDAASGVAALAAGGSSVALDAALAVRAADLTVAGCAAADLAAGLGTFASCRAAVAIYATALAFDAAALAADEDVIGIGADAGAVAAADAAGGGAIGRAAAVGVGHVWGA